MTKTCLPSLQRVNFTYTLVQLIYWSLFAAFAAESSRKYSFRVSSG